MVAYPESRRDFHHQYPFCTSSLRCPNTLAGIVASELPFSVLRQILRFLRGADADYTFAAVALTIGIAVGVLHVLAAGGLIAWTGATFNRIVGRAPQRDPL